MDNILKMLGLHQTYSPLNQQQLAQQQLAMQQQYYPKSLYEHLHNARECPHENCPVCKAESLKRRIAVKKQEYEKEKKRKDYEKRCEQFMKKWRANYKAWKKEGER